MKNVSASSNMNESTSDACPPLPPEHKKARVPFPGDFFNGTISLLIRDDPVFTGANPCCPKSDFSSMYQEGQAHRQAGKHAAGRENFEKALGLATNGVEKADAQIAIGLTYEAENKYAEARAGFEKTLAIEGVLPEQKARARCSIGITYYHEKKYPAARAEFEKVLAIEDAGADWKIQAQMLIGRSFGMECQAKNLETRTAYLDAKNAYAGVVDIPGVSHDQKADAQMAAIHMLAAMKTIGIRAHAELLKMLGTSDLSPEAKAFARLSLGKCLFYERDYAAARNELAKAMALDGLSDSHKVESQLYIGLSYYKERDFERAGPEFLKVMAMPGADAKQIHAAKLRLTLGKLIPGGEKVLTVLFIGASQTQVLDVPQIVEVLAASAPAGSPRIITAGFLRGGTGIQKFWEEGEGPGTARAEIMEEPWDCVVFETHPVLFGHDIFVKYATKMANLVSGQKATPIFFEAPAFFRNAYPADYQKIHDDTVELAKTLKVPVAPADYAWMKYLGPTPTPEQRMALYHPDAVHPSRPGSYLIACAIYSAITGLSPVGLTHSIPSFAPDGISPEEAAGLQKAAWEAFLETKAAGAK